MRALPHYRDRETSAIRAGAFTLIELMIVITIIGILAISVYTPYETYSNIARVRYSADTLRQTIGEARVDAVNGSIYPGTPANANIGVLLTRGSHTLQILAYPHDLPLASVTLSASGPSTKLLKEVPLEDGVTITGMTPDYPSILVYIEAPYGRTHLLTPGLATGVDEIAGTGMTVQIAFRSANTGSLVRTVDITK